MAETLMRLAPTNGPSRRKIDNGLSNQADELTNGLELS